MSCYQTKKRNFPENSLYRWLPEFAESLADPIRGLSCAKIPSVPYFCNTKYNSAKNLILIRRRAAPRSTFCNQNYPVVCSPVCRLQYIFAIKFPHVLDLSNRGKASFESFHEKNSPFFWQH